MGGDLWGIIGSGGRGPSQTFFLGGWGKGFCKGDGGTSGKENPTGGSSETHTESSTPVHMLGFTESKGETQAESSTLGHTVGLTDNSKEAHGQVSPAVHTVGLAENKKEAHGEGFTPVYAMGLYRKGPDTKDKDGLPAEGLPGGGKASKDCEGFHSEAPNSRDLVEDKLLAEGLPGRGTASMNCEGFLGGASDTATMTRGASSGFRPGHHG